MSPFIHSLTMMLVLLNPFLLVVYLLDLIQELDQKTFSSILIRAGLISIGVFVFASLSGEYLFTHFLHAKFASFQVFGGIVFLIIGLRFVFQGTQAMRGLRGDPQHIAGAIAMPILIGPATISAAIISGENLGPVFGIINIFVAVAISILTILGLKKLHDFVAPKHEGLVERYVEIAGRVTALVVGTFSIEMILQGITSWMK
ncbi:MAG: MarC family protein [Deltaproteobacteria bacterium]|nr:MarC family protein [Deltaproteobacteria bacterium]